MTTHFCIGRATRHYTDGSFVASRNSTPTIHHQSPPTASSDLFVSYLGRSTRISNNEHFDASRDARSAFGRGATSHAGRSRDDRSWVRSKQLEYSSSLEAAGNVVPVVEEVVVVVMVVVVVVVVVAARAP